VVPVTYSVLTQKGNKSMTISFTTQQKKVIISVDSHVKTILKQGGNEETLLVEMLDFMPAIKNILDVVPKRGLVAQAPNLLNLRISCHNL